jgi:hypothetical protein
MTERKIKKAAGSSKRPEPTVQHESSADSAQNIGTNYLAQEKIENSKTSSHRRTHKGSDGGDQERGSNH